MSRTNLDFMVHPNIGTVIAQVCKKFFQGHHETADSFSLCHFCWMQLFGYQ